MHIHIHHHRHDADADRVAGLLASISTRLGAIERLELLLMTTVTDLKNLVAAMDAETNTIAAKVDAQTAAIADLSAKVAAGGVATQADLDAIGAGLTPISERLKTIGADPAQPIPAEPVVPTPPADNASGMSFKS